MTENDTKNAGRYQLTPAEERVIEILSDYDNASTGAVTDRMGRTAIRELNALLGLGLAGRGQPDNVWWLTDAGKVLARYLDTASSQEADR